VAKFTLPLQLVPFFCDVIIGEKMYWQDTSRQEFTNQIQHALSENAKALPAQQWE